MNEIEWTSKAARQFRKLAAEVQTSVGADIYALANWPQVQNVKKLVNRNDYRLRSGNYRVVFTVHPNGTLTVIRIEEVKKRDEHTY